MNRKRVCIILVGMLIGVCFLSSMITAYPPKENKGKTELVKIHDNNYYDMNKIYAILVFYTALENNIDFDNAVMMGFSQLSKVNIDNAKL